VEGVALTKNEEDMNMAESATCLRPFFIVLLACDMVR